MEQAICSEPDLSDKRQIMFHIFLKRRRTNLNVIQSPPAFCPMLGL